jgi:hypothetical protein
MWNWKGTSTRTRVLQYADLVREVATTIQCGDYRYAEELAAKCGYDLLRGIHAGNAPARARTWKRYIEECKNNFGHTFEERDGVWVPAIPWGEE